MDKKDELYRGVIADLIAGHDKEGNINVSDEDWEIVDTISEEINKEVEEENKKEKHKGEQSLQEYARLNRITNSTRSKNIQHQSREGKSFIEIARKNRIVE
ncbi:hypothetical protein K4R18_01115 [Staphylococcus epidermidis]|nr:hypothetical protein [Staphylococcus epidermidis]MCG1866942.1 hypothetical protein [Staphylococcus epidermidis]MCG2072002.1 hypothetical protein [Staphylococcus epidermidis]MCG2244396.1 hypothetical protein [Staphylococcus epidermidis]MCG2427438.1 hypothetical protein [Staphylococcus epidermidis]